MMRGRPYGQPPIAVGSTAVRHTQRRPLRDRDSRRVYGVIKLSRLYLLILAIDIHTEAACSPFPCGPEEHRERLGKGDRFPRLEHTGTYRPLLNSSALTAE